MFLIFSFHSSLALCIKNLLQNAGKGMKHFSKCSGRECPIPSRGLRAFSASREDSCLPPQKISKPVPLCSELFLIDFNTFKIFCIYNIDMHERHKKGSGYKKGEIARIRINKCLLRNIVYMKPCIEDEVKPKRFHFIQSILHAVTFAVMFNSPVA